MVQIARSKYKINEDKDNVPLGTKSVTLKTLFPANLVAGAVANERRWRQRRTTRGEQEFLLQNRLLADVNNSVAMRNSRKNLPITHRQLRYSIIVSRHRND